MLFRNALILVSDLKIIVKKIENSGRPRLISFFLMFVLVNRSVDMKRERTLKF